MAKEQNLFDYITKRENLEKKIKSAENKHKKFTKENDRNGILIMNYRLYDLKNELLQLDNQYLKNK